MTIADFLAGKPVQLSDLFGPWKCKGFHDTDENAEEKITKKLAFVRCHFGKLAKKNPIQGAALCKFKRGAVGKGGDGEWMLVLDSAEKPLALFSASCEGFVQRPLQGASAAPAACEAAQKETPHELRTTWVNYELLETLNARAYKESCEYWDKRDGQPEPVRKDEDDDL